MKIYLNVSCLNRPFDDQEQSRIRLEAAAVGEILENVDEGHWRHVSSEIAQIEIQANPDPDRRARVQLLLPEPSDIVMPTDVIFTRAAELELLGFKAADALHIAAAEHAAADVLLSCDDRFCRATERSAKRLRMLAKNPLKWLEEMELAADAT
jgi:predicted nucleic acid-binding protein